MNTRGTKKGDRRAAEAQPQRSRALACNSKNRKRGKSTLPTGFCCDVTCFFAAMLRGSCSPERFVRGGIDGLLFHGQRDQRIPAPRTPHKQRSPLHGVLISPSPPPTPPPGKTINTFGRTFGYTHTPEEGIRTFENTVLIRWVQPAAADKAAWTRNVFGLCCDDLLG